MVIVSQHEIMFHRYISQPSPTLFITSANKSWLLDSACCNHMTPHASHFSQKTPLSPSPIIYTADSSHMSVSHMALSLLLIWLYLIHILFQSCPSIFSLLVNFVNLALISTFLIMVLMCKIHWRASCLGQAVRLDVYLSYATCRFPHIWSLPLLLPQPSYLQIYGILVLVMPLYLIFSY